MITDDTVITITTGHSDDGGFDFAQLTVDGATHSERWKLSEELAAIGGVKRLSGYEIVDPYIITKMGLSFTVAQYRELIANIKQAQREREERRRLGLVKCACGHVVAKNAVMSTSGGTSCPDCYDRMEGEA